MSYILNYKGKEKYSRLKINVLANPQEEKYP
jgi:hypothetical protein